MYPEHEKLQAVQHRAEEIGRFLDWLSEHEKYSLVRYNYLPEFEKLTEIGYAPNVFRDIIGEYLDIDQKKLDQEKDEMVKALQNR